MAGRVTLKNVKESDPIPICAENDYSSDPITICAENDYSYAQAYLLYNPTYNFTYNSKSIYLPTGCEGWTAGNA